MKKYISYMFVLIAAVFFAACQNKDLPGDGTPIIAAPDASQFQGQLNGYDYTISWPQPTSGRTINLTLYKSGAQAVIDESCLTATSYTLKDVDTNVEYWFVFRESDGTNQSLGTIVKYTRPGATKIQNLTLKQVEQSDKSNDLVVTWDASDDAETYEFVATSGATSVKESIAAGTTTYTIKKVTYGDTWDVSVTAANSKGKAIPQTGSLLIGKTHLAFLSDYASAEELIANGDDDDASAWLWFKENYPNAEFLPFSKITSAEDLEPYRMLFFSRDLDDGSDPWEYSAAAKAAAPYIGQWAKAGGNMLLWSHAVAYIGYVGRLDLDKMKEIGADWNTAAGGNNGDTWKMGASIKASFTKDLSSHPIYTGTTTEVSADGITLVPVKGGGWTEDHNFCLKSIPVDMKQKDNKSKKYYDECTEDWGIYPLGTWDSQCDHVGQLNVWEAAPGNNVDFKGRFICIGNGGLNFSMKNSDGSKDVSANPKNNSQQANVLKIAKNAVNYLMSK